MNLFADVDWAKILLPQTPILELIVRISVVYLALVLMFRFVAKREAGGLMISDLLVIVLIADAVQNGMSGSYTSVGDALILAATLLIWDYVLSYATYRWRWAQNLLHPPPRPIIVEGRPILENWRREFLSYDEVMAQLRLHGVQRMDEVALAVMESDGRISVLRRRASEVEEAARKPV